MKIFCLMLVAIFTVSHTPLKAQSFEIQQLVLNIQKLSQLKSILSQMYKGYKILSTGYNTVKDLSQGNFSLHKTFLDGLLQVSPSVRKYKRIADIVYMQQELVRRYKRAFAEYTGTGAFSPTELQYFDNVYSGLFDRSLKNLEELLMVVTAGELRMNDAERLQAIDRIYDAMKEKLVFLGDFNERVTLLSAQRDKSLQEYEVIEKFRDKK